MSPIPFYRGTKQPAVGKGTIRPYRQRSASMAQLKRWFAGGEHNLGLVTGAVSRLLVLDIDPRNGGDQSVKGLPMPPTPTVLTHDGRNAYFRHG
ncbi:MAG TPA: bifunctional DNA primase/polymerase [Candidatus Tectomicrobia bacterium]